MAKEFTYNELLNEIHPALMEISKLAHPNSVPVSHHLSIAKNIKAIEGVSKEFWDVRENLIQSFADKDDDGNPVHITENGQTSYKMSDEAKDNWTKKYEELIQTKVEVDLDYLHQEYFEGVKDLAPMLIAGVMPILKVLNN